MCVTSPLKLICILPIYTLSASPIFAPVRGAHYDPQSRPSGVDLLSGGTGGWVAPSGGSVDNMSGKELAASLAKFTESQTSVPPPHAPRGSPDFMEMLESQGKNTSGCVT